MQENLQMAIATASSIGVVTIGLHPAVIIDKYKPFILGFL